MESKLIARTAVSDDTQSAWVGGENADGMTRFFTIIRGSLFLMVFLIAGSVAASLWLVTVMTPYWRAEIVVIPVDRSDPTSLTSVSTALGGLGRLVGRQDSLKDESLAVLRSRELFDTYAKDKNPLPMLFDERWDPATATWKVPPEDVPTLRDGFRLFDRIREIVEDRRTGIVTLAITWKNREQAVMWAHDLIDLANKQLRARALEDSERNMRYLTEEMRTPNRIVAQNALTNALATAYERQLQNYMFAKGQDEYAFRVIDQPTMPDERERVSPRRSLIVAIGFICGTVLAFGAAYVQHSIRRSRKPVLRQA